MNLTCPACHAKYSLDAALEGDAAGELQLLLARDAQLARPLIAYLGLFRGKTRALSFDRAVRLAREVLAITDDRRLIAAALVETVEAMRAKRDAGDVRPLKNHNYLRRVMETVDLTAIAPVMTGSVGEIPQRRATKIGQAEQLLAEWAGSDQLRQVIGHGLAALLARPLYKSPEVAAIDRTAALWERDLLKFGLSVADAGRVEVAFDRLLSRVKDRFPVADDLFEHLPRGKAQQALPEPPPDPTQVAEGKRFFAEIAGGMSLPADNVDPDQRRQLLQQQARQLEED